MKAWRWVRPVLPTSPGESWLWTSKMQAVQACLWPCKLGGPTASLEMAMHAGKPPLPLPRLLQHPRSLGAARLSFLQPLSGRGLASTAGSGLDSASGSGSGSGSGPPFLGSKRRSRGPVMAARKKAGEDGEKDSQGGQYKDTVCLPTTSFNMRANAVVREPEIQRMWKEQRVVEKLNETATGPPFTLHDGPPYANGDLHMGHALNKILKDIINRYQMLQGRKVKYVPGWDCHGLPIELKVLQSMEKSALAELTPIKLRKKAAQFALKTVNSQRTAFQRYGVWGEWDEPYLTLSPEYEAAQIGVFGQMFLLGHIYRGKKPVHWSPSSQTALAEAELEYPEGHVSRSVYVAMRVTEAPASAPAELRECLPNLSLVIWTTTPWTMPGNAAVAVNEALEYAIVSSTPPPREDPPPDATPETVPPPSAQADGKKKGGGGRRPARREGRALGAGGEGQPPAFLIVAKDLVPSLEAKWGVKLEVKSVLLGAALEHMRYQHPLEGRDSPVVLGGDYITTESGTGLVHTAPGHGLEDYATGLKYNLPLLSPVDDRGNFTEEAGVFAGQSVLGEGNEAVIEALDGAGALLLEEAYGHKYPYDWRTKKPTIFRATEQWFASVAGFRDEALEAIGKVQWIPPQGEKRIRSMTAGRSDWCISRQRSWGVPIPVFYHVDTGEALMTEETIKHLQAIISQKGSDAWFYMDTADLLPPSLRHEADKYRRGSDTMDVWFDSGSSWAAVVQTREGLSWPADLYLEGSDQHRGWFQSSLLTAVAARGQAPYKQVLTHGFVLDERGYKMSKSLGNVVDPRLVIEGGKNQKEEPPNGADVLRLWAASVDYSGDVLMGPKIMRQTADVYRKLRGTLRYLLSNLYDWEPTTGSVPYEDLPALDRYLLRQLAVFMAEAKEAYEAYQFYKFYQAVQRFAVVELSNFYFDVCKDRLYVGGSDSHTRRSCQTALATTLLSLTRALAPIVPHTAEDAWAALPFAAGAGAGMGVGAEGGAEGGAGAGGGSVFQARWPQMDARWAAAEGVDVRLWETLRELRGEVNKVIELARTNKLVGASLEGKVYLHAEDLELAARLKPMAGPGEGVDRLCYLFLVSQVEVVESRAAFDALEAPFRADVAALGGGWEGGLAVAVARADGAKCERCWNYSEGVGSFGEHPTLCERCHPLVAVQRPLVVTL